MTQDEIIRMAREAGFLESRPMSRLNHFAALVAANLFTYDQVKAHIQAAIISEREACAKVCEKAAIQMNYSEAPYKQCAAAIRARGE